MDVDNKPCVSTENKTKLTKKSPTSNLVCAVCKTSNAQSHYGAICCVSCKMFFRRNSQYDITAHSCTFGSECDITLNTRRACRYCRLKKCSAVGMQRELLRAQHQCQGTRGKKAQQSPQASSSSSPPTSTAATIHPIDLLHRDRSMLNNEQWSYLSNVINAYNTESPSSQIRQLMLDQSVHPMKVRVKAAQNQAVLVMTSMYQSMLPFLEKVSNFPSLNAHDRTMLMERNIQTTGGYNGIVIFREGDLYDTLMFRIGFPAIYGPDLTAQTLQVYERSETDSTLIKLLLPALIFSTGSDHLTYDASKSKDPAAHFLFNTRMVFQIQNFYVDVLFKYMIYRYSFREAALRFAGMIKSIMDQIMCAVRASENQIHNQLLSEVSEDTERSLKLDELVN